MGERESTNTFPKYTKIKALGHDENKDIFLNPDDLIVIEEKIDGGNFRFSVIEGELVLGSRTQVLDEKLQGEKNWKRCCDYIRERLKQNPTAKVAMEGLVFYGELCRRHTIGYDFGNMPPFIGFDIFDLRTGRFLDHEIAKQLFNALGIDFVPVIKVVKAKTIKEVTDKDVPKSEYYDGKAEGIVFKNYDKQIFGKYVRERFKEDNKRVWGGTPKYEETDSGKIMARYCTNARIEKIAYKLRDEGHKLDMTLMKHLPKLVYEDIVEEEWKAILLSQYKIDCRKMKRIVCKRCVSVLKQMMVNQALD